MDSHMEQPTVHQWISAQCKNRTRVLLVQHPAPWCLWSSWSTLIHLGPQFLECSYTKWTKQDQGGPGVDQRHTQDHGAGWWTRSVQHHRGPPENIVLIEALQQCLLLATRHNLDLEAKWISTQANALADALSRLDYV